MLAAILINRLTNLLVDGWILSSESCPKSIKIMRLASLACVLTSVVFLVPLDLMGQRAEPGSLPNLDRRHDRRPRTELAATAMPTARTEAEQRLRQLVPTLQIDRHPLLDSPQWVRAREGFLTPPKEPGRLAVPAVSSLDPHHVVKQFVQEYAGVFGHDATVLDAAPIRRDYVTTHNGLHTTVWEQEYSGLPVFQAVFLAHTTARGELVNVASQFVPDLAAAATAGSPLHALQLVVPPTTAAQAVINASTNIGEALELATNVVAESLPEGAVKRQRFTGAALKGDATAELTWLPLDGSTLRLCWEVWLTGQARNELFRVLVDVETGEIWIRHARTSYATAATYRVFTGHSPTPKSPGYAAPGQTNQPAVVSRQLITLDAVDDTASPAGWIPDGANETLGNNVDAHLDADGDNVADLPRPQGSPARVFDFPIDFTQSPTAYRKAAVVNLFYWGNWMHDKLYELGFTEAAGNFQSNNFGRGGLGGDAVQADAQDGAGKSNANFATPKDGLPPRMQMFIYSDPKPNRDGDFDTEIMLHEYTHGLSNRLVGGGTLIDALQPSAMGEGWSDFYALALLSQAAEDPNGNYSQGAYAEKNGTFDGKTFAASGDNYYFGCRRYPYSPDLSKSPLTFKDIDSSQADAHPGVPHSPLWVNVPANEEHMAGEVWCATLWEMRVKLIQKHGFAIGNPRSLQLVTDGMKLAPPNPTFLQARDAILQAEQVMTGGADKNELWQAFAKRGMGASATSPANWTTTGVVESFDVPDTIKVTPLPTVTITGFFGGPFTPAGQNYVLTLQNAVIAPWKAGAQPPLALSATAGILTTPSPTASVTATIGAGANSLPVGSYSYSVTFTNTGNGVVQARHISLQVNEPLVPAAPGTATFSGYVGSPMQPLNTTLVVANRGGAAIHWTAVPDAPLVVAPASGSLNPGQMATLTISLDGAAVSGLTADSHVASLLFKDDTTGQSVSRQFTITLTEPLAISPKWPQVISGPVGGPFTPSSQSFTLGNQGSLDLPWHAEAELPLVCLPANGTIAPNGGQKTLVVGVNLASATALGYGVYTRTIRFTDDLTGAVLTNSFTLRIGKGDYLTEDFHYQDFDLAHTTLTFTPDGSPNFYELCREKADTFPTSPAGGSIISENSGYGGEILLSGGKQVSLFGVKKNKVNVTRDGFVDLQLNTCLGCYWDNLRVQAFYDFEDLKVGTFSWKQLTDRVAFTWDKVGQSASSPNSFQIELFFDGRVRMTWLDIGDAGLVSEIGLSRGAGPKPNDFVSSDLSEYPLCSELPPAFELPMTVSVPSRGQEGGRSLPGTGSVALAQPWPQDLVVSLTSSDTARAVVPASVTIPQGKTNAVFNVTIIDDNLLDGSSGVVITATAAGHTKATDIMLVDDNESATLTVKLPAYVKEGSMATGTVSSDRPVQRGVVVLLTPTQPDKLAVNWPLVLISSGTTSTVFTVTALDNKIIGGAQTAGVTASVAGWKDGTGTTQILDNEPLTLQVRLPASAHEGDGTLLSRGEVFLTGFITTNLPVALSSADTTQLTVPASVLIPAGKSNAFFNVTIVDNNQVTGAQFGTVVANAAGFTSGSGVMVVFDNDGPAEVFNPQPPNLAEDVALQPTLSWGAVEGELIVNGGFEAAGLDGWTREDVGGGGWVRNDGTADPESEDGPLPPLAGAASALVRQNGNGRHGLWQDVTIPEGLGQVTLRWSDRIRNHAADFAAHQQYRVELRDPDSNQPLSVLFTTQPGEPLLRDWTNREFDLSEYRGQQVRLAFVEEDALGYFNVHLDNVSLIAVPPAPTSFEVYCGTVDPPGAGQLLGTTSTNSWKITTSLAANTTYYWQVIAKRGTYQKPGPVWQFVTGDAGASPVLTLSAPGDFSLVHTPTNLLLVASIPISRGGGSSVGRIEFMADGLKVGEATASPFRFIWTNPPPGEHVLQAVGRGGLMNLLIVATSPEVHVSVVPPIGKTLFTLVPFGATWSYNDTGANLGTNWSSPNLRARSVGWKSGPAKLGYGEGDEATTVSFGNQSLSKHVTTYFRLSFTPPPVQLESLMLRVLREHGVVVYLNGVSVLQDNLPAGTPTYTTTAIRNLTSFVDKHTLVTKNLDPKSLLLSANAIAAEVHLASPDNLTLSFDLQLAGIGDPLPTVALTSPGDGTVFTEVAQLPLTADAADPYGAVGKVEFFVDGSSSGVVTSRPYQGLWIRPSSGTHTLKAVVTDVTGHQAESAPVTVTILAPPALMISSAGGQLQLNWPVTALGYQLETTTSLSPPVQWQPLSNGIGQIGGQWQLTLPAATATGFFRLRAP